MSPKLFVIGSGFTHAVTKERSVPKERSPLNDELLQAIDGLEHKASEDLLRRYGKSNVEVALTKLDLDIAAKNDFQLIELRRRIEAAISQFFRRFRYDESLLGEQPWILEFVRSTFCKGDIVVSLNYDCMLEGLLDRCGLWTPHNGYGKTRPFRTVRHKKKSSPVIVLKIHGSENFCRRAIPHTMNDFGFDFTLDESIFPSSGRGKHFCLPTDNTLPALIAPSFVKVFPSAFNCLMVEALDATVKAEKLILIGCGMRAEDVFLYMLLWKFFMSGVNPKKKLKQRRVFILDPIAEKIKKRIDDTLQYSSPTSIILPINRDLKCGWPDLAREIEHR